MGAHPATVPCSLRCGAAVRRPVWPHSAGFLVRYVRYVRRSNGADAKMSCVGPTAWSYPHNDDSDSEAMPPGPWWGEALLEEDSEFFPLVDFIPVGQGRKELDAIWRALVAAPLESVQLTLREILAAGNLFRCRSFHVGTLTGALLVVAGVFQLCKTTPTLFVDIVLGSVFYKLSVLSAQLQREGKSFSLCARIQLVLVLILSFKDNSASQGFYRFLVEVIWFLNIYVYLIMAYDATVGVKHGRLEWLGVYRLLRTKGGLMKVLKHTFLDIFGGNKKPVSIKRRNRKGQ